MRQLLTPEQKAKIKKQEERRRRERQRREDEYRRRIERLRRQIEDARKRRQRMLLMLLLAILTIKESIFTAFQRSHIDWPDALPKDWTPDPRNDFAPHHDHDDYCDGYSREQWNRMLDERGIKLSRKAEMKAAWEADPEREHFATRYQDWGYKPYLGEIMHDLTDARWQAAAFEAIKLLSPPETHKYLDEAYATAPGDIRQCFGNRDADIIAAFQNRSLLWEESKRREAEEAQKAINDPKPNEDEKKFDP